MKSNMRFTNSSPLPAHFYGQFSPLLASDDIQMNFTFQCNVSVDALEALVARGDIPVHPAVLNDFRRLDLYLDVPLLKHIVDNTYNQHDYLWLYKLRGFWKFTGTADAAAAKGHLETLKWIRANGGEWTDESLRLATKNKHQDCITWLHENKANFSHWTVRLSNHTGLPQTVMWKKSLIKRF